MGRDKRNEYVVCWIWSKMENDWGTGRGGTSIYLSPDDIST